MDRQRGDRSGDGGGGGRHSRMPSRWSDGPPPGDQHHRPSAHSRGGGGGPDGFAGGRHHPYRGGPHDYPSGGGGGGRSPGFRPGPGGYGGYGDEQMMMGGPRRGGGGGFQGSGRGGSPNNADGIKFAKLFVGSVPRTATEEDIRPLFEEHGHVIEVALIKDKRTGQQQGCCFIKYATSEEADGAIRGLHNQVTLPGGLGPIQVRYADGERERLVEHKLFVGSLNKQATEKEIEEIFSPYGRVEDVYIMRDDLKQSRGCGFVKFSNREMAAAAINALNGVYTMRGCEQPLIVRFADPKRPRAGESRGGPTFGGPGFSSRSQAPFGARSNSNIGEPMGGRPPNGWHSSPESMAPSSQGSPHGFSSHLYPKGGFPVTSSATGFSPSGHIQPLGQQISPLQKQIPSPQHLPPSLQLHQNQQNSVSYSQAQSMQIPGQQLPQLQAFNSGGFPSFPQTLPSQQLMGLGGKLPSSQPILHPGASGTLQVPVNLQQGVPAGVNQQQLPGSTIPQLLQQPVQHLPAQMLQQHAQALQAGFQTQQQAFSQLQQHLQLMQPSNISQQQSSQPSSQTVMQQSASSGHGTTTAVVPSITSPSPALQISGQPASPLTCSWTEHTSPEGFKYYYNSITKESKWEKPEELTVFEHQQKLLQQQQQQKHSVQQLQSHSQLQPQSHVQSTQQISQMQQAQVQMQQAQAQIQLRQQAQLQQLQPSLLYQASGAAGNQNTQDLGYTQLQGAGSSVDPARVQKMSQVAQEWMWKNKPTGT